MPYKPTGNPNGRPPAEIDLDELEGIVSSALNIPISEVATALGVHEETLSDRMKSDRKMQLAWKRGERLARLALRQTQFKAAKKGNAAMMIWLGKQYLAQVESVSHDVHATVEHIDRSAIEVAIDRLITSIGSNGLDREPKRIGENGSSTDSH